MSYERSKIRLKNLNLVVFFDNHCCKFVVRDFSYSYTPSGRKK